MATRTINRRSSRVLTSVSLLAMATAISTSAMAQQLAAQTAATAEVEEIVVTGSRIVRDGYEAPTPVSVLGVDELAAMAQPNISDAVNRLPAFANSVMPRQSAAADMTAGVSNLNLRGINPNRTLVLVDGKRLVGTTLAGFNNNGGSVDVNAVPGGLVARVDVVTGGASAVYGSDALAGVVNFVFDRDFTGIKGEVFGGITTYGDGENYKVSLTAGTPFAGGRGHLLAYADHDYDHGILHGWPDPDNARPWAKSPYLLMVNPAYTATSGAPQYLAVDRVGLSTGTRGGLIVTCPGFNLTTNPCPLRGTQFLEGGVAAPFAFGPLVSGNLMQGGDWESSRIDTDGMLGTKLQRANTYLRASYDIADNVNIYGELGWSWTHSTSISGVPQFQLASITVLSGNPFIPAAVQSRMTALGITSFTLGSTNGDLPQFGNDNVRHVRRYVAGVEGNFDAMGGAWNWEASFARSSTHASVRTPGDILNPNKTRATDAVLDANGRISCRVNTDAITTNDDPTCVPYNVMGLNVNSPAAIDYATDTGWSIIVLYQDVFAASMTGEPFSTWAGPVSLAFGGEHRIEKGDTAATANDINRAFFAGNFTESHGRYSVTEGFVEVVVPLAKDTEWASSLDVNGAVRGTDYSTSGYVTTWKVGATWKPVDDLTLRATRSRDIRAPNLGELFIAGRSGTGAVIDRVTNFTSIIVTRIAGNPDLVPEVADTTGLGVVYQPSWLPGFGASADFYNIDISGAIVSLNAQAYVDRCHAGETAVCAFIERDANNVINFVRVFPANVLAQKARGLDIELSYSTPLSDFVEDMDGTLGLRFLGTHTISNKTLNQNLTIEGAGASGSAAFGVADALVAPKFKYIAGVNYNLEPFSAKLTIRGISGGVYNNEALECMTGCPASTPQQPTIGFENKTDGRTYFDLALDYEVIEGVTGFFVVDNLFNTDPPRIAGTANNGYYSGMNVGSFDRIGRVFRAGARFRM